MQLKNGICFFEMACTLAILDNTKDVCKGSSPGGERRSQFITIRGKDGFGYLE